MLCAFLWRYQRQLALNVPFVTFSSPSEERQSVYNMQAKTNLDVSEMTQQIQLIESKFVELTTRLHLKDVEIANLEHAQKVQYL